MLSRAGLTIADIDLFEVNEAFAPVVLSWAGIPGADLAKTNVNGGAIAIGHPLGASGARIMTTWSTLWNSAARPLWPADDVRGWRYGHATIIERL